MKYFLKYSTLWRNRVLRISFRIYRIVPKYIEVQKELNSLTLIVVAHTIRPSFGLAIGFAIKRTSSC